MAYTDEILADTPLGYWRLNELSGTTVVDSSGNGRDGSYNASRPPTYGAGGALETDGSNTGVWFNQGGFPYLAGEEASISNSALSLNGQEVSVEVWAYAEEADAVGGMLGTNPTIWGNIGYGLLWDDNGRLTGTVRLSNGSDYQLIAPTQLQANAWYHFALTRSGAVMRLYVNGALAAERTNLPTLNLSASSPVYISGGAGTNTPFVGILDEAAVYSTALSATRVLAHYNAAKTARRLLLQANARSTTAITFNVRPPVPLTGLTHNWLEPARERLSWLTDVLPAYQDKEQRVQIRQRPRRSLEYTQTPATAVERARLHGAVWKDQGGTLVVPIWSDFGLLTGAVAAGVASIPVATIGRDYDPEGYFQIGNEQHKIAPGGVSAESVTISTTLANSYPAGTIVCPARRATLDDSISVHSHAADYEDLTLPFSVLPEEKSLNRITAYTPAYTYRDFEVFTLGRPRRTWLEKAEHTLKRRIEVVDAEVGTYQRYAQDTGSPRAFPVRLLFFTRADIGTFFGWLDARKGRLNPFWVPSWEQDFVPVAPPSGGFSSLVTYDTNYRSTYSLHVARRHVAFCRADESINCVRITGASASGANEQINFGGSLSSSPAIQAISFLKLCRLASDTVELLWHRAGAAGEMILEVTLKLQELLEEV